MQNHKIQSGEGMQLYGVFTFTKAKLRTPEQFALNDQIVWQRNMGLDVAPLIKRLNSICETEVIVKKNLLPTVGRAAVAHHLTSASPNPSSLRVNYVALGSGSTTPANGNTQLNTEVYRNTTASQTNSNNTAYITGFFSAVETTGTYAEAGLFIGASGTANSGSLFSHVLISITKSATETLTVDWTVTIS